MSERPRWKMRKSVLLVFPLLLTGMRAEARQHPPSSHTEQEKKSGGVQNTRKQITYGDVVINDFQ